MNRILFLFFVAPALLTAESLTLTPDLIHVRNAEPREWSHFAEKAAGKDLTLEFAAPDPAAWKLLTLRQAETKQRWLVTLNDKRLGDLVRDTNDQQAAFEVPAGLLLKSGNRLRIHTDSETPDDVLLGEVEIHDRTREELTAGLQLSATVTGEDRQPLPCRFTIVDAETGTLVLLGAESDDRQAVRPGVVYALEGQLSVSVRPDRNYRVFIGRGFEYELLEFSGEELAGHAAAPSEPLILHRQVPTPGLVSCDTHLHTLEFARHGDCNVIERLISVAGEGIELAISTEHDQHIDYAPEARRIRAHRFLTPVVGCEVTTHEGHFNIFPVDPAGKPAEHKLRPWPEIFRNIYNTGATVCILNHGRDLHGNFRPFDPAHWDVESGLFTDGRKLEVNGMELINSGATQTDPLELARDWMALLRSGHRIAGIGSSDSHTVNYAIPGQARTYIPIPDEDPANLDVDAAVAAILEGRTHVSYGLLTKLEHQGDRLIASVWGPDWTQAESLTLFVNGRVAKTVPVPAEAAGKAGLKFETGWDLADFNLEKGDFLVAIAQGPGIDQAWWSLKPPYKPQSPDFHPQVVGISSAVFPVGRE